MNGSKKSMVALALMLGVGVGIASADGQKKVCCLYQIASGVCKQGGCAANALQLPRTICENVAAPACEQIIADGSNTKACQNKKDGAFCKENILLDQKNEPQFMCPRDSHPRNCSTKTR